MNMSDWTKVGSVCVDSGSLVLIDPGYMIGYTHDELLEAGADQMKKNKNFGKHKLGMLTQTTWGDGRYNVYMLFGDGENPRPTHMMVVMDESGLSDY